MSEYQILTVLAAFAFFYSVFASRLEQTPVSGAVVYLFAGLACGPYCLNIFQLDIGGEGLKMLAEFTLALVLFSDSANSNLSVLRRVERVPVRLLVIGLPLTIAAGFGAGYLMFDQLTVYELALLATMLAPTDAALGQAVVTNKSVPESVRASLNVESGLNDGICVPVLLIFLALATGSGSSNGAWLIFLEEIGIGAAVGVALAVVGSSLVKWTGARGWIAGAWTLVPVGALAMLCFALSQWLGGSGFIGSFVGGLTFGGLIKDHEAKEQVLHGAEGAGNVLSLLTWFVFGAVVFGASLREFDWQVLVYAVLSLTILRMLPVFLCLIGVKVHVDSKLFIGWFGPRGLASIVFIVMVLNARMPNGDGLPGSDVLSAVVAGTVALSIIAHGLSAVPLVKTYANRVAGRNGVV